MQINYKWWINPIRMQNWSCYSYQKWFVCDFTNVCVLLQRILLYHVHDVCLQLGMCFVYLGYVVHGVQWHHHRIGARRMLAGSWCKISFRSKRVSMIFKTVLNCANCEGNFVLLVCGRWVLNTSKTMIAWIHDLSSTMQLIGFDPKFTGVAWCCPEHILYAQLFTMKCLGQHIGQPPKSHCSLLPGVLPLPPRHVGVEIQSRWLGWEGFFAFLELHGQVVGCFAFLWSFSLFKSSRGFVGLLRWMQRHGKSAKCKCLSCGFCWRSAWKRFFSTKK